MGSGHRLRNRETLLSRVCRTLESVGVCGANSSDFVGLRGLILAPHTFLGVYWVVELQCPFGWDLWIYSQSGVNQEYFVGWTKPVCPGLGSARLYGMHGLVFAFVLGVCDF